MDRPLRKNCKEFGMEKFLTLLLAASLLAGCHVKPTAEQERQSAEVARQNDEAARNRQAEEAARKLREELGDEIDTQMHYWSPQENLAFLQRVGYQVSNGRMFINRKTGTLTIMFDCHFVRRESIYVPLIVRLFDANGQYITHIETGEIYGRSDLNRNNDKSVGGSPLTELKEGSNSVEYDVNLRDANYIKQAEFGLSSDTRRWYPFCCS
jgi:hypothetical protein